MRSTKDQLVEKDVLIPVKQCFPVEPSGCRRDSPLVSMEIPLRTAYGQNGRCGMQPKPSSLRAQAHQSKSRTETCELVKVKQKLLEIRAELQRKREAEKKRTREVREQALPSEYHHQSYLLKTTFLINFLFNVKIK
ncbi:hypothetical protein TNCV_1647641 [Trichonephila clavipes]|nr:hypothetical protein TNCV_1647641 [Trichonephila clavipes]